MDFKRRMAIVAIAFVAALPTAVAAIEGQEAELKEKVDAYLQACADVEQFSGAVLVVRDGQEIVSRGFGMANVELESPNSPQTKFRLGSVTKQFTALAVLILEEQGKLRVDDLVNKHLEDCPDAWQAITIHHLLSHTSGIPNFTNFPDYLATMRLPSKPEQTIARFKDKPLEFVPGEKFAYSNSGYIVLGAIIEKVSGKSYEQFLREAIFEPLEMRDSGYDHHETILPHRAAGYEPRIFGGRANASFLDLSVPFAAGGLYSTVGDLRRWDEALRAGKLVSAESLTKMFTPVNNHYGYGWNIQTRGGHTVQSHGGGINGFSTFIVRIPDMTACVVVLSNVIPSPTGRMGNDLASIILDEPYKFPGNR